MRHVYEEHLGLDKMNQSALNRAKKLKVGDLINNDCFNEIKCNPVLEHAEMYVIVMQQKKVSYLK